MKHYKPFSWLMTIAIATLSLPLTACSNDDETVNVSIDYQTEPMAELCAYGVMPTETRGAHGAVFTDDDIEWFDLNTRELRFRDTMEPLREEIPLLVRLISISEASTSFQVGPPSSASSVVRCLMTSYSAVEKSMARSLTMVATISMTAILPNSLMTNV